MTAPGELEEVAMRRQQVGVGILAVVAVLLLAYACVDERIVYRDRDLLGTVPAAAAGFLGYHDAANKLTVCGNCHVGQQQHWQNTAHADAWVSLQESGHARQFCEACHTVSHRGHPHSDPNVGFTATRDPRYHDVQCESCHGPGLLHVQNPTAHQPLAPHRVSTTLEYGCGECHSGVHHPFVEEWEASRHATLRTGGPQTNPECAACHTARGAFEQFRMRDSYLEQDEPQNMPIVCGVCHDPHRAEFEGQLRFSIEEPSEQQNLCMRCHQKRGRPDPTTFRGPHAPEGPLLLGDAGWWPPNMPIEPGERIAGTHGSAANPRLCAGCHMQEWTVTDSLTGALEFRATGHRFEAIPCMDATRTRPIYGECDVDQRTFRTCAVGCHGTEDLARQAIVRARNRIDGLRAQLDAQLAQVPASEFDPNDNRYTTAEGARFNSQLAALRGSETHNPFLIEALLTASIQQVQQDYGIAPPDATISLENILGQDPLPDPSPSR
jgi:predicted CXXCH cytochrome family protein